MPTFRTKDAEYPILNLEQGRSVTGWGRMIFYVSDVDGFWAYLRCGCVDRCSRLATAAHDEPDLNPTYQEMAT